MSDRLFLYCHLFDFFILLCDCSSATVHIDEFLIEAAEDPALSLEDYAELMHYADTLLGR